MQAAGADVFLAFVDQEGDLGQAVDGAFVKADVHALGRQQGHVLAHQRVLGFGEDALEVVAAERAQFDADREAALQLRDQVGRLGHVEGARGDEQDVVGLDRAVFGADGRTFDQRQQVALHAFAADVAALHVLALGDLVDFIDEDDAVLLAGGDGLGADLVFVDQLAGFFLDEHGQRRLHRKRALLRLAAAHGLEHLAQLLAHFLHARRGHDVHAGAHRRLQFEFDLAVVEFTLAQLPAQLVSGFVLALGVDLDGEARAAALGQQGVEDAVFGALLGLGVHALLGLFAEHLHRHVGQVADDLLDVLADVADLGEARGLDLHERRVGQRRQAAGDFGLADAGGADHQDVLGHHLVAHGRFELHAPPAVAQGDGDGAFGAGLADDVTIEFADDLAGGQLGHQSSSITILRLV